MPIYRVKPNLKHGKGGRYGGGSLVELEAQEAAAFLDKLEYVGEDWPPGTGVDGDHEPAANGESESAGDADTEEPGAEDSD